MKNIEEMTFQELEKEINNRRDIIEEAEEELNEYMVIVHDRVVQLEGLMGS